MANGVVNEAVAPHESGHNIYFLAVDNATGNPITQGVCITGTYNTQCCNCWPSGCSGCNGCTSGSGGPVSIYTDKSGVAEWSIPFTCSASWSLLFQTPGYEDELLQIDTGPITGPTNVKVGMSAGTAFTQGAEPPQCLGLWADLNQAKELAGQGVTKTGGKVVKAASNIGLYAVVGIALVAVVLIVLAATGVLGGHHGGGGTPSLPSAPTVGGRP